MCGITGIMSLDSSERVDPRVLHAMTESLRRRGPDDAGHIVLDNVGLGMRRLSIIDVDGGHQPIANEDESLWIVFNGEVFNFQSLASDLRRRGHRFRTHTDTETVLHLFEEQGPACLQHLRGMFALAIWDVRKRQLFIARDRLGIKPLHYFFDGRRLIFGSEIKSILKNPAVSPTIDWTAVDALFAYGYIPAPWTVYRELRKLLPGHYLIAGEHGLRQECYWDLKMEPKLRGSDRDLEAEFVDRFKEVIRIHMLSDVPLGAFLSGGVDSSLVVAMMAGVSQAPIKTFTTGFGGETGSFLDERTFAREVSKRYKTCHRECEVLPRVEEAIDVALDAFDEPFADDSLIPTHHICGQARQHVTVALTGLGGDEAFAGYARYLGFAYSREADRFLLNSLLAGIGPLVGSLREARDGNSRVSHVKRFVAAANLPAAERWQQYHARFSSRERQLLYRPEIASQIDFDEVDRAGRRYYESSDASDPVDKALYQDIKMYLADDVLALTDRVGMWHSLELRVPYLDHTLLEFCAQLPVRLKIRFGEMKRLLRRAAIPYLPNSVLSHRKQGFSTPMAMWLRGSLREYVATNLSTSALNQTGVLDPNRVKHLVEAHQSRRELNERQIFSFLMFQRWIESKQATPLAMLVVPFIMNA